MKHVADFFTYARDRQEILIRRKVNAPEPWTDDPVLYKHRFCNIYREDDKTTQWFRTYVRDPLRNDARVLLATVVFRMFNRIETGEAIFNQLDLFDGTPFDEFVNTGDVRVLKKAIKAAELKKFVTGAYTISSPPGYNKWLGVLEILRRFYKKSGMHKLLEHGEFSAFLSMEQGWEYFRQFDYFGTFHSYEIVTDLRHTVFLEDAPDINTWANPGPGAKRGINRVFGRDKKYPVKRAQIIEEMREVLLESRKAKHWPVELGPPWELREVEHTLCEFDKYLRTKSGEGRPRGRFR